MATRAYRRWYSLVSLFSLALVLTLGAKAFLQSESQEHAPPAAGTAEHSTATEHGKAADEEHGIWEEVFHWANFLIILGGIWYLGKKLAVPFLEQRTRAIQEDMKQSARAMEEASQRLSQVEAKLGHLDDALQQLRQSTLAEASAERERIEEAAQADADKIVRAAEQEIAAAGKAARRELKTYASELAMGLAEQKIRGALSPEAEKKIFRSFLDDLRDGSAASGEAGPSGAAGSPASPQKGKAV